MAQPGGCEAGRRSRCLHRIDVALVLRRRGAGEGQCDRPQVEIEQAIAQPRLVVVIALRLRSSDDLDLAGVEPEAFVDRADLRLSGLRVGQEDAARAALRDGRCDAGVLDVGQRLRGEDHRHVFLAQRLQPLADARGEHRVVEEQPGFVEDQERGRAIKTLVEAGKQITEHRQHSSTARHQLLHLEALHVGRAQPVAVGIEQTAVGAAEHVRCQRLAQCVVLQQHGEAGQRALLHRRACKAFQRRPDSRLLVGADGRAFSQHPAFEPFGGPGAVALLVDARERLERDVAVRAEIVVLAAQAQDGGAHRAAHVEGEDARAWIAAELHRQGSEQHGLAHAGRSND